VYRSELNVPFRIFAWQRARLLAVDEMRKDGVLIRGGRKRAAMMASQLDEDQVSAPDEDMTTKVELRDLWDYVFSILCDSDRKMLIMYYVSCLTFKQIGAVLDLSESAISVRYRLLIARLRRLSRRKCWA
jgi:RNA polymerase sigma factor (sigma-70 family)